MNACENTAAVNGPRPSSSGIGGTVLQTTIVMMSPRPKRTIELTCAAEKIGSMIKITETRTRTRMNVSNWA